MTKAIFDKNCKASLRKVIEGMGGRSNVFTPMAGGYDTKKYTFWTQDAAAVGRVVEALAKLEEAYFGRRLRAANVRLKAIRDKDARIKPAFEFDERRKLIGILAGALGPLAVSYHQELGRAPTAAPQELDKPKLDAGGANENTLTCHLLKRTIENFITYFEHIADNLIKDWDAVEAVFFPGYELKKLLRANASGADLHKHGKQVVLLSFEAEPAKLRSHKAVAVNQQNIIRRGKLVRRVVYKPSNLALDYLLLADSATVNRRLSRHTSVKNGLPARPGNMSLLEKVNELLKTVQWDAGKGEREVALPTYLILPRNELDTPTTDAEKLTRAYSYIEFLTNNPELEPDDRDRTVAKLSSKQAAACPGPQRDWIASTNDELKDFYAAFGWSAAVAVAFGMADVHSENMITHGKLPAFIDVEISFKVRTEQLKDTLMHELLSVAELGKHKSIMCYLDGTTVKPTRCAEAGHHIKAAMLTALRYMGTDGAWKSGLKGWLEDDCLNGVFTRHTTRKTADYYQGIDRLLRFPLAVPPCGDPPDKTRLPGTEFHDREVAGAHRGFYGSLFIGAQSQDDAPQFALSSSECEDYYHGDVPIFFRKLGEKKIYDSQARPLDAVLKAPWNNEFIASEKGKIDPNCKESLPHALPGSNYMDFYPAKFLFEFDMPAEVPEPSDTAPSESNTWMLDRARPHLGDQNIAQDAKSNTIKRGCEWVIVWGPEDTPTSLTLMLAPRVEVDENGTKANFIGTAEGIFEVDNNTWSLRDATTRDRFADAVGHRCDGTVRVSEWALTPTGGYKVKVKNGADHTYTFTVEYKVDVYKNFDPDVVKTFDYPVEGLDDPRNPVLVDELKAAFSTGGHALGDKSWGATVKPKKRWWILDPDKDGGTIYHVLRWPNDIETGTKVRVFTSASGKAMGLRQLELLTDAAHRRKLSEVMLRQVDEALQGRGGGSTYTAFGDATALQNAQNTFDIDTPPVV